MTKGRFGHCDTCIHHDGYIQCDKGDPLALEMSAGGVVTWWKCAHCALTQAHQQAVKERDGWQADARAAQANWHAACQDIHDLKAQLQQAVEALAANKEAIQKRIDFYDNTREVDRFTRAIQHNEASGCLAALATHKEQG